jgi:hypothetical protein
MERDAGCVESTMSTTKDQFWQYANEAYLSAYGAKTEKDREEFFDLARTWTQAALAERRVNRDAKIAA